jgi:hypothetical protein
VKGMAGHAAVTGCSRCAYVGTYLAMSTTPATSHRRNLPAMSMVVDLDRRAMRRRSGVAAAAGVLVIPQQQGTQRVTRAEMRDVIAAVQQLPAADIALLARHRIAIHLVPAAGLGGSLLGATTIEQSGQSSRWVPTSIRVAVRAGLRGSESTGEIVQHEIGHAIAVLRHQDRSEEAAIAYANKY